MAPDGSRLEDAMRELLNVADGLDPEDCREIAQGDQRIRKLIEEVCVFLMSFVPVG